MTFTRAVCLLSICWVAVHCLGCGQDGAGDDGVEPELTYEELLDPATCQECHPTQYDQWSGSMHAYAAEDPVFRAMNARGQEATDGELGDFCVSCHAPMAVRTGATTDGLNLDEVPDHLQGVTCYFCHSVDAVEGTHNNPLRLAEDLVIRGPLDDPTPNEGHASMYSAFHDRNRLESSDLCGSCHDIVIPAGVLIERTYQEWQDTLYASGEPGSLSCGSCHMRGSNGVAADYPGLPLRRIHDHSMPGVDVALTPFPNREEQLELVQSFLDTSLFAELCVETLGGPVVTVSLENIAAGHSFPSGAAQDRRVWVELTAWRGEEVIFESGHVPDGLPVRELDDPTMWTIDEVALDENGDDAHMHWEIRSTTSTALPGPTALSPLDPDWTDPHREREFVMPDFPTRVSMRVRIRPIGLDILDELIETGHLDPGIREVMPTFTLAATELEWTDDLGVACVPD